MHDWLLCESSLAPCQVQVSNLSRKGWVCSLRTHRSTGEKVMFTAAQGLSPQQPRWGFSGRPLRPGLRGRAKGETLGNGLKTQINIGPGAVSTGENEGKGQETGLSRDIGASRLPRAGETGQDPLGTEARGRKGWTGVDAGLAPARQGPCAPPCTHLQATLR